MKDHNFYIQQAIQDLTCYGYEIHAVDLPDTDYIPIKLVTNKINGDTFLPDIVCEKNGELYMVEVKTGWGGISYDDTFEQLKKISTYTKTNNIGFILYIDWAVYQSWSLTEDQLKKKNIDNFILFHTYFEEESDFHSRFLWHIRSNLLKDNLENLKTNVYNEAKPDKILYPNTNCGFTPDITYTLNGQDYLCVCMSGFLGNPRFREKLKMFDEYAKDNNKTFIIYVYQNEKTIQSFIEKDELTAHIFLSDFDSEEGRYESD